jgi:hypothetical protein
VVGRIKPPMGVKTGGAAPADTSGNGGVAKRRRRVRAKA